MNSTRSSSTNDRLLTTLPVELFQNLISRPRATQGNGIAISNPIELRRCILEKLMQSSSEGGGNGGTTAGSGMGRVVGVAGGGNDNYTTTNDKIGPSDTSNNINMINNNGSNNGITTVQNLLILHPTELLYILDPLLTSSECKRFLERVHSECASRAVSAWEMMMMMNRQYYYDYNSNSNRSQQHFNPIDRYHGHSDLDSMMRNNINKNKDNNNNKSKSRNNRNKIPSGLPTLDKLLKGGFPVGTLTEIIGRAGVGKTQLAQQLCVMAASSSASSSSYSTLDEEGNYGMSVENDNNDDDDEAKNNDVDDDYWSGGGGSIYIDAERKMSLVRLKEIAACFAAKRGGNDDTINGGRNGNDGNSRKRSHWDANKNTGYERDDNAQKVLENVTVHSLLTTNELMATLDQLDDEIMQRNSEARQYHHHSKRHNHQQRNGPRRLPVRLLVIDSIAAPIRRDYDLNPSSASSSSASLAQQRAATLFQIARKLKQLAHDFQLAVVLVNQVGGGGGSGGGRGGSGHGGVNATSNLDINDGEFTATLGTAWQYCVSTRIVLEHEEDPHKLFLLGNNHNNNANDGRGMQSVRTATIAKSLVCKRTKLAFELNGGGLSEVP